MSLSIMKPAIKVQFKAPTEYPPSETVQSDALTISEMFQRYNQQPEQADSNYFDASESEYLQQYLKPNIDLTDLDRLSQFNNEMTQRLSEAQKRQQQEKADTELKKSVIEDEITDPEGEES